MEKKPVESVGVVPFQSSRIERPFSVLTKAVTTSCIFVGKAPRAKRPVMETPVLVRTGGLRDRTDEDGSHKMLLVAI